MGLVEVTCHKHVTRSHACMKAKGVMDVYRRHPFYIKVASFGKVDVHLPKYQKVGEIADTPVEAAQIREELFRTPSAHT